MGLVIAGDRSGVGKTTITLAMLAYLATKSKQVQSFKVGPDYIDPMFHTAVTGLACRNLDPVLTSPDYVKNCYQRHAQAAEYALVEGVMGLFDGIYHVSQPELRNDYGSTAHIARLLNLPVLLVLDCSRLSTSAAAIAYGYANLDPRVKVIGVILNQVASDRHLELLETALNSINLPIVGVLRRNTAVSIPDRHLGLVPSAELSTIQDVFARLADLAQTCFDWDRLLPLVGQSSLPHNTKFLVDRHESIQQEPKANRVRIAVARDRAFNFYYQDNLDLLTELGAELVFWSPLEDTNIPLNIQGLYFGGGFPEVFASELAANEQVLQQLKQLISQEMPTYAECGGLMYLCEQLIDLQQQTWSLVGIIPSTVTMKSKLTLGYRKAIALQDSVMVTAKQTAVGHEFHRSRLIMTSEYPQWQLKGVHRSSSIQSEGWNVKQVHASYLHLHWGCHTSIASRWVEYCRNYKTPLY
ncbi:MAG: cobyrinate a,c-diamide synthase [Cyanobacteria bacterium J06648_1]